MTMKLKKSDVNLLIMVFGVLIGVASYFFVYTKFNEKTDVLNGENATLQTEVDYLQDLANNKQKYIDDTETMQAEIDEIKAQFPAEYRAEDDILYIRGLEKDYDASISSLNIGSSSAIEVSSQQAPVAAPVQTEGDDLEGGDAQAAAPEQQQQPASQILLYSTPLTVEMTSSYLSVKDVIAKLNTDHNRKSIEQLSASFDSETGDLTVSLGFNAYSLTGTEKVYTEPVVDGVRFGTNNIFNSADKKKAIQAEEAAKQEAAEQEENSGEDAEN